ncbi:MAG: hypothetical protein J6J21_02065 [Clostridia bacterium]|nr:hypothetical protein [Clostridia bacterium]MBQ2730977.1 hypothetical protein [Clostridia bacterium]
MSPLKTRQAKELFRAILALETEEDCSAFLEDLCTVNEIIEMSQRLDVAKNLLEKKTFNQIGKETGASSATISRVNKCVLYGGGGYQRILSRLAKEEEK